MTSEYLEKPARSELEVMRELAAELAGALEELYDAPHPLEWGEAAFSIRERQKARTRAFEALTRARAAGLIGE